MTSADPLGLREFADDDARLAAAAEGLEAERSDLEKERDRLRRELAVARHLGDGDPVALAEREGEVGERLGEIERELAEIGVARAEVARRCLTVQQQAAAGFLAGFRTRELEARAVVGELAERLAVAKRELDEAVDIRERAQREVREIDADERALKSALAAGRTDGLAAIRQRRDRQRTEHYNRTIRVYRDGRLDENELTEQERAWVRDFQESEARIRAERERIAREAGTFPVTLEELDARGLEDGIRQHETFPRIGGF